MHHLMCDSHYGLLSNSTIPSCSMHYLQGDSHHVLASPPFVGLVHLPLFTSLGEIGIDFRVYRVLLVGPMIKENPISSPH